MPSILALALNRNSWHERGWNGATSCARKKKKGRQKKGWKRVVCATVCGFIQWLETRRQKSQKIWFFLSRGAQHVTVFLIKEQRVWAEWSGDWPWYNGGPLEKRVNNIVIERKHFNFWSFRWNVEEERVRERVRKKWREERRSILGDTTLANSSSVSFLSFFFSFSSALDASNARSNLLGKRRKLLSGVDNENYARNRNSFPLYEHRPSFQRSEPLLSISSLHFEISPREHPSDRKNPILSGRDWGYVSS